MDPNHISLRPGGLDEIKLGVDDAQVIAKTLPPPPMRGKAGRSDRNAARAARSARDYVIERPMQSVLIAAAGGAALTAGLIAWMRADRL